MPKPGVEWSHGVEWSVFVAFFSHFRSPLSSEDDLSVTANDLVIPHVNMLGANAIKPH